MGEELNWALNRTGGRNDKKVAVGALVKALKRMGGKRGRPKGGKKRVRGEVFSNA